MTAWPSGLIPTTVPDIASPSSDFSAPTTITILPSTVTLGRTLTNKPIETGSEVLVIPPNWFAWLPVIWRMSDPTWTKPSVISRVIICGRLNICNRPRSCNARIIMWIDSLAALTANPPYPRAALFRPIPKPEITCPAKLSRDAVAPGSLPNDCPCQAKPFVDAPLSNNRLSWRPSSTPASKLSFSSTSAIITWIITISGSKSSSSTRAASVSKVLGWAEMITELLATSQATTTSVSSIS